MSTSNLVKAIGIELDLSLNLVLTLFAADSAFVDRADIVQYIDLPSRDAIYEILRSSLCEIVGKGIVNSTVKERSFWCRQSLTHFFAERPYLETSPHVRSYCEASTECRGHENRSPGQSKERCSETASTCSTMPGSHTS